ncbi:MAG: FAD-dependent oxidoreductase [Burkholderiales bacterium]|nr:FAD-dependent oxidoreductase [Burkholderiales bacterium]
MTHVVIAGAGIAGIPAAYALKNRLGPNDQVTVVSDRDYFNFVPSNPWIAMGWRNRSDIAFPIAPYLEARGINFVATGLAQVHAATNRVELLDGSWQHYDYLVLATGTAPAYEEVAGMDPAQGFVHSVIHIEQAVEAANAYKEFVKQPGAIVIGAAAGCAILGPMYETAFLIDADLRRRGIRERATITLVTPEPYVAHFGIGAETETRRLLENALAEREIVSICNMNTTKITAGNIHLTQYDPNGKEMASTTLPFAFGIYAPAYKGIAALSLTTGLTNARGMVTVDEYLRNPTYPNVYAAGICVAQPSFAATPVPVGPPESVYSIQNQVDTVARNIIAAIKKEPLFSAQPQRAKWLSDLSDTGAAHLAEPQIPLRNINQIKQGRWVHLAKVEFEQYFINKIKLKPGEKTQNAASIVATTVWRLQSEKSAGGTEMTRTGAIARRLDIPVERDANYELRALAKTLNVEEKTIAALLLNAAIKDAKRYLGEVALTDMERARRDLILAELPENQPGVEFHGGGT